MDPRGEAGKGDWLWKSNKAGYRGPAEWFTGTVRIDPRFSPPEAAAAMQKLYSQHAISPERIASVVSFAIDAPEVVAAEFGVRLEIRLQVPLQPDHFDIAVRLRLQPPA